MLYYNTELNGNWAREFTTEFFTTESGESVGEFVDLLRPVVVVSNSKCIHIYDYMGYVIIRLRLQNITNYDYNYDYDYLEKCNRLPSNAITITPALDMILSDISVIFQGVGGLTL